MTAALVEAPTGKSLQGRMAALLARWISYPAALAAGIVLVTVLAATTRLENPDLWWHLKIGEVIWNTRSLPSSDHFSFTVSGAPWVAHEWLAQVSIYAAYRWGGYRGLMIWMQALGASVNLLVYYICWLRSKNALVAFRGGMVAFCFGSVGLLVRPLLLGHVFLAAELAILETYRVRRSRWIWALPALFAVWVNCHGSFIFGLAVLAVYWACAVTPRAPAICAPEKSDA